MNKYINQILHGDCLDIMKDIKDGSIDMILCDLPYGTTACKWDIIIPFDNLWKHYKRIIKSNGAIVLFGSQPFTSKLIMSNVNMFRYEIIWEKSRMTDFFQARFKPMKTHENICIFYKLLPTYNPIKWKIDERFIERRKAKNKHIETGTYKGNNKNYRKDNGMRNPSSIISIKSINTEKTNHSTQKPTDLMEYLIETYTNEKELVMDNCAGSGTTAIACINTNRRFICVEKDKEYYEIAKKRIEDAKSQLTLF